MSQPRQLDDRAPVAILYTGGTFGMLPTPAGLAPAADLRSEISAMLDGSDAVEAPRWSYRQTPEPVDSSELGPAGLAAIADEIRVIAAEEAPSGIVVIHGTDTMAHSAAFTAFALADLTLPIIFTGAQRPLREPDSDARGNLLHSLAAASAGAGSGVGIAFGGRLLPAVRAVKRSSVDLTAFDATRAPGEDARGIDADLMADLRAAAGRAAPRIGLVRASPGLSARQLTGALEDCPEGLVLECYGSGTAPVITGSLAGPLREAAARGTAIVAITQCGHGGVELDRYAVGSALAEAGVVSGADMTAEAALGKLATLIRAGRTGARLRELLSRNLIGERRGV